MKKTISILLLAAGMILSAASVMASRPGQIPMANDYSRKPADLTNLINTKFVIEGFVDENIPDSCYNIYITDIDKRITDDDLVACVQVKDKRFRFETDINTMKLGRIQAIFPGNELCKAWIEIYFIPGFTLALTVHNGHFDIFNNPEYGFMVNAWLNREPLTTLCESIGMTPPATVQDSETARMAETIEQYRDLRMNLQDQIDEIHSKSYSDKFIEKETRKLLERIEVINKKIEAVIDRYANKISY